MSSFPRPHYFLHLRWLRTHKQLIWDYAFFSRHRSEINHRKHLEQSSHISSPDHSLKAPPPRRWSYDVSRPWSYSCQSTTILRPTIVFDARKRTMIFVGNSFWYGCYDASLMDILFFWCYISERLSYAFLLPPHGLVTIGLCEIGFKKTV